jgi:hypothetical protein
MNHPPYYFTYGTIKKFTDPSGMVLMGNYSEADLLEVLTSADVFSFTVDKDIRSDVKYYIVKRNLVALVNRLKSDAALAVKAKLINDCLVTLSKYEGLENFTDPEAWGKLVEKELRAYSSLLHALLTNPEFVPVYSEALKLRGEAQRSFLADGDSLVAFGELFGFTAESIVAEAKRELPFWYKLPLVSQVFRLFFFLCSKAGLEIHPLGNLVELPAAAAPVTATSSGFLDPEKQVRPGDEWKEKMRSSVKRILGEMVPEGSTLAHELALYEQQWNLTKSVEMHAKLTGDVNQSVREYVQHSLKNIRVTDFSRVRLRKMSDSLTNSPGLMKIADKENLNMYIQLYILRILETV